MQLSATLSTDRGDIVVELFPQQAPLTVANFANLALRGYYDSLKFHRVIENFMIQGGDPTGTGSGGPGYTFRDECTSALKHDKPGILSMANAGPGTNGSQFFITHVPTTWLDGKHTVFGRVTSGQDAVDSIQQGDKINKVAIHGDTTPLFAKVEKDLARWNKVLDERYPVRV
jgi:peptidyl-prolyl cis-trans isomerase B (cyclophilin B)